jgi:hypothetical protein
LPARFLFLRAELGASAPSGFVVGKTKPKEEMMKKFCRVAIVAMFWLRRPLRELKILAKGEKTFKAKSAGFHGADAAGKPA